MSLFLSPLLIGHTHSIEIRRPERLSANLLHLGLVNWKWATDGFNDSIDLAIASLISVIYLGSSGWYVKTGDRPAAGILGLVGLLQVAGVRTAM